MILGDSAILRKLYAGVMLPVPLKWIADMALGIL